MPVTNWDQVTFNALYQIPDRRPSSPTYGQVLGYSREGMIAFGDPSNELDVYRKRWAAITGAFPAMLKTERTLIVGCGFGFLIEAAKDAGFFGVYGIDSSPYIAANRATESVAETVIVADDVRGGGRIRAALRSATGNDVFDWIITEDVVACYDDGDVVAFAPHLESLLAGADAKRVIHMTTAWNGTGPTGDSALNWKTIDDWAALVPAHSWISTVGQVGGG